MNGLLRTDYRMYPAETAAMKLAEEQHAPGVKCRMNPNTFRIEYVRLDGSLVPGYDYFLKMAMNEGERYD